MANKQDLIAKVAEATELTKKEFSSSCRCSFRLLSKNSLLQVKKYN